VVRSFGGEAAQVRAFVWSGGQEGRRRESFFDLEEGVLDSLKNRIRTVSKPFGLEELGMSAERKQMPQVVEIPRNSGKD
jgi:hypothetical protein